GTHESGSAPQLPVIDGGRGGRAYGTCSHDRERRESTHGIPLSLRDGSSIAYDLRTFVVKKNRQESAAVLWRAETCGRRGHGHRVRLVRPVRGPLRRLPCATRADCQAVARMAHGTRVP